MNSELASKIISAEDAASLIRSGSTVAFGGYTSAGYPKKTAKALMERKQREADFEISVVSGSALAPLDELFADAGLLRRRAPMIGGKRTMNAVNAGQVTYVEQQMNRMPQLVRAGAFGKIDALVIEALDITPDYGLIPTSGVGIPATLLGETDRVIIEINTAQPAALYGMHDLYTVAAPPRRRPIPLTEVAQRIGEPVVWLNPEKIAAVVMSDEPDAAKAAGRRDAVTDRIAENLFMFLEQEFGTRGDRWLPPFQTGFGNLASTVVEKFGESRFENLEFFCGGINESCVELLLSGKVHAVSCGSMEMTPRVMELFEKEAKLLREKIILRNGEVTNSTEVVSRLGITALNTGIEIDYFGNVNASHISGNRVVNGLGGGASFAENAGLSVVMIPSEGKEGAISNIVPMVAHQDICHHDVDVIITEHGVADLRGKSDEECARLVIGNCAGSYQEQLRDSLRMASERGGHHPMRQEEALLWHKRLAQTGTMRA